MICLCFSGVAETKDLVCIHPVSQRGKFQRAFRGCEGETFQIAKMAVGRDGMGWNDFNYDC